MLRLLSGRMAEGSGDLLSLSVQKLDEELTCPVCQDHFKEPKVLPCLHYYCKKCVADLISRAKGKPFGCPECRREVQVADNDPESLPTAFFVNRMEEVYSVMKKAEPKESVKCENCFEQPSLAFCQNCGEYICEECVKAHKKLRQFSNHAIMSIDSLRTSMAKNEEVDRLPVVARELKCSKHKGEPLKLYCHTCYKLVCRDCIVIDHKGHEYAFVVDVTPKCKSAIKEKATSLQNVSSSLKSALASLADSKKKVLDHNTATMKAIDDARDKVASKLQQKTKELKDEATKSINESTEEITTQQKNAQLAMGEVESLLEFLHRNLEKATDQELLSLQKQMSDQADRIAQLYANPAVKFAVPRLPQLEVLCSGDVLQVLRDDFSVRDKAVTQTPQWKGSVQKLTSQLVTTQQQKADSEAALKETIKQKERAISKLTSEKKSLENEVAQLKEMIQELTELAPATPKPGGIVPDTTMASGPGPPPIHSYHSSSVQPSGIHTPPVFITHAPPSGSAAPQSSIPLYVQQTPFNASNPSASQQPMAPHATATPTPVTSSFSGFKPIPPLRPSTFNLAAFLTQEPTPQSNQYQPALATTAGKPHSTTGSETFATPFSSSTASQPKDLVPECPICLEAFKNPTKTKCGHKFCTSCIQEALQYDPYCPTCKKPLRPITGKQPPGGTMSHMILPYSVPGYEGNRTIQITYTIPSGTQGPEHPNPGQHYQGTSRVAYLPDNDEGREVFKLLKKAFKARLIFTVGTSVTTGAQNVLVWNDIHHKTSISGGQLGYGYPDPTYLQRVKEDLAAKGIVPTSVI